MNIKKINLQNYNNIKSKLLKKQQKRGEEMALTRDRQFLSEDGTILMHLIAKWIEEHGRATILDDVLNIETALSLIANILPEKYYEGEVIHVYDRVLEWMVIDG